MWEERYCLEYFISGESYVCGRKYQRWTNFCSKFNLVLAILDTKIQYSIHVCGKNYQKPSNLNLELYKVSFLEKFHKTLYKK